MTERVQGRMGAANDHLPAAAWDALPGARVSIEQLNRLLAPLEVANRASHMDQLSRIIETQVIPHLVAVHRDSRLDDDTAEVIELARRVVDIDPDAGSVYIESLMAGGVGVDAVCLDLLAPAARRLGALWEADRADFAQVTIGLLRLHRLLSDLGRGAALRKRRRAEHGRYALLAAVPGEQHTFGIAMVAEFFRRNGWHVRSAPLASTAELALIVRNEWYAVAGLSAGSSTLLANVTASVQTIRAASCNPAIAILAGGPLFAANPALVSIVGADATASDAREAAVLADALLADQSLRD